MVSSLEDVFVSELVCIEIFKLIFCFKTRSTTRPQPFFPSTINETIRKLTQKQDYSDCHQLPPEGS
jgi:hypothetical protein